MRSISMGALACAALWGCGSAGGDPRVLDAPGRSTAPAANTLPAAQPVDLTRISVRPMSAPATLAIDGDVREWGDLRPVARTPDEIKKHTERPPRRTSGAEPTPEALEKVAPHRDNPRDAETRLALAFTADGVVLAGALAEAARNGVFLGVGSEAPLVPPLGEYTRGGGFDELICPATRHDYSEGSRYDTGEPNPPEVIAACKQVLARHEALKASHEARFSRMYRIDASGIRVVGDGSKLTLVEGAKVIWKATSKGATFEATMPLAALPRFSQAPLSLVELVARPAPADPAAPPPTLPRVAWFRDWFDAPVSFEPLAELRARMFAPSDSEGGGSYAPPAGLSYQAGDPTHVETLRWADGITSVKPQVSTLYTKKMIIGAFEVGVAEADGRYVAVFKDGKLVDAVPMSGTSRGMVTRAGELHFIGYTPDTYVMHIGLYFPPSFSVLAVGTDGKVREAVKPLDEDAFFCTYYEDVTEITSPEMDRFGFRATCAGYQKPTKIEVTWTWSPTAKLYVPKLVQTPVKAAAKR